MALVLYIELWDLVLGTGVKCCKFLPKFENSHSKLDIFEEFVLNEKFSEKSNDLVFQGGFSSPTTDNTPQLTKKSKIRVSFL